MTSYQTSIDIFSISRTVFEIFDFKVFRVWPCPLTFKGHHGSQIFSLFESSYMTSYLTSIDTFLYRVPFSRYLTSKFSGFDLDLWPIKSPEVRNISTIWKPIHDFLSNIYWHFLYISYCFRDIRLQSFQGLTLTFALWGSPEVEDIFNIRKPTHDFLSNCHEHILSCVPFSR